MIKCPNCSGSLRFHISSQKMKCDFCNAQFDPYEFDKKTKTINETEIPDVEAFVVDDRIYTYNTTVFVCPECGGELLGTDTDVTGFCSFCGANVIFHSRISEEKRPEYIIPFQITKEECKSIYEKKIKRAWYAPKELKNVEYIDGFRGIYVPYWMYDVEQREEISLKAVKEDERGSQTLMQYFELSGYVNADYERILFDASASFSDNISEVIAPYQFIRMKKFTPGFLSGFYADTSDVDYWVYEEDVIDRVRDLSIDMIQTELSYDGYAADKQQFRKKETIQNNSGIQVEKIENVMLPVWFMSYRNKDRVAYAVINGQTGKISADIPVDYKKYLLGTVLCTIPIFLLFNFFFTVKPENLLMLISVIAVVVGVIYGVQMKNIYLKEKYLDDKGVLAKLKKSNVIAKENKKKRRKGDVDIRINIMFLEEIVMELFKITGSAGAVIVIFLFIWSMFGEIIKMKFLKEGIILIFEILVMDYWIFRFRKYHVKASGYIGILFLAAAFAVNSIVTFLHPVSDIYYYMAAMISLFAVFLSTTCIIRQHNRLATRKIPQFDRKGGDDGAV